MDLRGTEIALFVGSVRLHSVTITDQANDTSTGEVSAAESEPRVNAKRRAVRILLADDHRVVRSGLASLLGQHPDLQVVAEAENGLEALELARQKRPDLILMDVVMPQMGGVEATKAIKATLPEIQILGLSMFDEKEMRQSMIEAGACRYLSKSVGLKELLQAIHECMNQRI